MNDIGKLALFWLVVALAIVYCGGLTFMCVSGYSKLLLVSLLSVAVIKLSFISKLSRY